MSKHADIGIMMCEDAAEMEKKIKYAVSFRPKHDTFAPSSTYHVTADSQDEALRAAQSWINKELFVWCCEEEEEEE